MLPMSPRWISAILPCQEPFEESGSRWAQDGYQQSKPIPDKNLSKNLVQLKPLKEHFALLKKHLITRCLVTNLNEMKPILKRFDYWVETGFPLLHACRVKDALHHTLSKDSSSSSTSSCASSSSTSSSSSVHSKVVNLDLYSNQKMIKTSKLLLN